MALAVRASRHVRVRDLVHDDHRGRASDDGVEVQLLDEDASVLLLAPCDDLEAIHQRFGLRSPVRVDPADDDVDAPLSERPSFLEHPKRLAHAGSVAHVELELPPLCTLDELEKILAARAIRPAHRAREHGEDLYARRPSRGLPYRGGGFG